MEKLQTNGCEQGESDLQERAFSVLQFTNLVTQVLLAGTLAEPQLTSGRKHKWQKENGNKSSALPHLRPERSSQDGLVTAPSASKPQKYGGHCSANLPRPLYSLSPREDDRCPQANLTQLHWINKPKGQPTIPENFPLSLLRSPRQRYYMYLLKLHISLWSKMLNYFLKLNPKAGYYLCYLIVDDWFFF